MPGNISVTRFAHHILAQLPDDREEARRVLSLVGDLLEITERAVQVRFPLPRLVAIDGEAVLPSSSRITSKAIPLESPK